MKALKEGTKEILTVLDAFTLTNPPNVPALHDLEWWQWAAIVRADRDIYPICRAYAILCARAAEIAICGDLNAERLSKLLRLEPMRAFIAAGRLDETDDTRGKRRGDVWDA